MAPCQHRFPPDLQAKYKAAIVEGLSNGTTLESICRDPDFPSVMEHHRWMREDEQYALDIAYARSLGYDRIAADALAIVDDVQADPDPQSRRNRADIRLRLLAKWDRARYGDQPSTTIVNNTAVNVTLAPETQDKIQAAKRRLSELKSSTITSTNDDSTPRLLCGPGPDAPDSQSGTETPATSSEGGGGSSEANPPEPAPGRE